MLDFSGVLKNVLSEVAITVLGFCGMIAEDWEIYADSGILEVVIVFVVGIVYVRIGIVDGVEGAFLLNCDEDVAGVMVCEALNNGISVDLDTGDSDCNMVASLVGDILVCVVKDIEGTVVVKGSIVDLLEVEGV